MIKFSYFHTFTGYTGRVTAPYRYPGIFLDGRLEHQKVAEAVIPELRKKYPEYEKVSIASFWPADLKTAAAVFELRNGNQTVSGVHMVSGIVEFISNSQV